MDWGGSFFRIESGAGLVSFWEPNWDDGGEQGGNGEKILRLTAQDDKVESLGWQNRRGRPCGLDPSLR